MKIRNRLKKLLHEVGIKSMIPTDELLHKLGDMTVHRFNRILNNDSKTELTLLEVNYLKQWLASMTNRPQETINLIEQEEVGAL